MPYAELDGLRLYYERAGSGEPELLFVHGWCCDRTAFKPQFDHFARTHAVTALDLRGCGRSDCPADGYTIPDFADDLARFCAEVGIEKPVVVGHSLGGMIGVELAARHPSVPGALVLVDPGPIDPLPETVEFFNAFARRAGGTGRRGRPPSLRPGHGRARRGAGPLDRGAHVCRPAADRGRRDPRRHRVGRRRRVRALHRPDAVAALPVGRRTPTRSGCARSSPTSRSGSPSAPATSTTSRCPSR